MEKIGGSNIDNIAKVLEPLGRIKTSNRNMRFDRPNADRIDIDFSAISSEPHLIMLHIINHTYSLGYEDGQN